MIALIFDATGNLTVKAQLRYNALGQRTQKIQIAKPVNFHYGLNQQLLGESAFNADNTLYQRTDWIYLDALPIAQIKTSYGTNKAIIGTRLTYIHTDHLGTPRLMTDSTKKIVWRWDGDAFGQTPPNQNPDGDAATDTLNLRFPGQYADVESGLYYNLNRYYDPIIGRYITSDPIGLKGGMNLYVYVNGNPVSLTDPLGLDWVYHQSTGQLQHVNSNGNVDYTANGGYAGHGTGVNNPEMENVRDIGPINQGNYRIEPQQNNRTGNGRVLPNSMRLTPDGVTDARIRAGGRTGGYLIHGPHANDQRDSSNGCPIFPRNVRDRISNSDDNTLRVER